MGRQDTTPEGRTFFIYKVIAGLNVPSPGEGRGIPDLCAIASCNKVLVTMNKQNVDRHITLFSRENYHVRIIDKKERNARP